MKNRMAMIVFISIVLLIHIGVNYYIFKHTKPIFDIGSWVGISLKVIFFLLVLSYPVGRILERLVPSMTAELIAKIGAFWLGAMLYLTLIFLLFDILKLIFSLTGFTSFISAKENISIIRKISLGIYASTAIILIAGFLNALYPKVSKISIKTDKSLNGYTSLKIVAASDIHLGTIISNGRLERFVRMMNEQKADIMLLAGDIFDEDLGPVIKNDMGKLLSQLNAPLGVFAVTGNHEYIGGVDPAIKYLEEHGITVVRDTVITLNDLLNIVGRDDRQAKVMGGINRMPIEKLVKNTNKDLFTIMLDHQPFNLHEAVENGIDLQISGHTHHGQMFPLNLITNAMFEVSRGHKQIENTHIYVSTGFGTWGPPVRVGNRPEIVVIEVTSQMD
jgi:uncharacterized protein